MSWTYKSGRHHGTSSYQHWRDLLYIRFLSRESHQNLPCDSPLHLEPILKKLWCGSGSYKFSVLSASFIFLFLPISYTVPYRYYRNLEGNNASSEGFPSLLCQIWIHLCTHELVLWIWIQKMMQFQILSCCQCRFNFIISECNNIIFSAGSASPVWLLLPWQLAAYWLLQCHSRHCKLVLRKFLLQN